MLIEFKVSNFRSIREQQTLSLLASSEKERRNTLCVADFDPTLQCVPSAALYGPNASGKSNLIFALAFVQDFVLQSARESQHGDSIPIVPFLFDKTWANQPSEFEITFSFENTLYQYGFLADAECIHQEWLYVYSSKRPQRWFFRQYDSKTKQYQWDFSKYFVGKKKVWHEATRNNALFLSTAVQLNNEQLMPIFSWFKNQIVILSHEKKINLHRTLTILEREKTQILEYLKIADPSILDVSLSEREIPKQMMQIFKRMEGVFGKEEKDTLQKEKIRIFESLHPGKTKLSLKDESSGTRRLLALAGYWLDILEHGKTLIFDELENSLHPLLVTHLIQLLANRHKNKKNAQLIFSTHHVSLLNTDIFRRDQIWFTEKNADHATQLYSLLEFKPRKDQSIEKNYLLGRYGALPFIQEEDF
jgi:uncharacterized protein